MRYRSGAFAGALLVTTFGATPLLADESVVYTYDELGRLIATQQSGTINNGVTTAIGMDKAGNRTTYKVTGSGSGSDGGVTGTPGSGGGATETPPSFSVNDAAGREGDTLVFTVTKAGAVTQPYAVQFATVPGSAGPTSDYTPASGQLTFLASETTKTVAVTTKGDNEVEPTETFLLSLSSPSGGSTLTRASGTGTLANNAIPSPANDTINVGMCSFVEIDVLANDGDPDGDYPLTIVSVSGSSKGQVTNSGSSVGFSSSFGATGATNFTYTIRDTRNAFASATVGVTIINDRGCD